MVVVECGVVVSEFEVAVLVVVGDEGCEDEV